MGAMNITPQQAEKVLKGELSFSQLGFSMMIARLRKEYIRNPSQATLHNCAEEMNLFLGKFNKAMNNDYEVIAKL